MKAPGRTSKRDVLISNNHIKIQSFLVISFQVAVNNHYDT